MRVPFGMHPCHILLYSFSPGLVWSFICLLSTRCCIYINFAFRQLNVMDETYVINQVKEDACFVSLDYNTDMRTARDGKQANHILRDYVLPDFTTIKRGYVRSLEESTGKSTAGEQVGGSSGAHETEREGELVCIFILDIF